MSKTNGTEAMRERDHMNLNKEDPKSIYHTRSLHEITEDIKAFRPTYLARAKHLAEGTLSADEYKLIENSYMELQYELTRALNAAGLTRDEIEGFLTSESHIPEINQADFELFFMTELLPPGQKRTMPLVIGELAFHQALDRHLRGLPRELFKGDTAKAFYLNADKVSRLEKELAHLRAIAEAEAGAAVHNGDKYHVSPTFVANIGEQPRRSTYKPSMGTANRRRS